VEFGCGVIVVGLLAGVAGSSTTLLARPSWWLLAPFLVAATAAHALRLIDERRGERK
jgi:hypothetical protein